MAIIWKRRNPPATDERIAQFEAKEQLILPESYKVFLRRMNGGILDDNSHVPYQPPYLGASKDLFFVTRIFSLGHISQRVYHFKRSGERWWGETDRAMEARFPHDVLPIGGWWSGREDLILDLATGAIYLWFAEYEDIFAAPNITTFLQEVVQSGEWNEEEEDI
jgi:hypothetical protein